MAVKSRKLRFEVLKRDSFKCQYCGAEAPRVLLHVDHILPEAKGGADDLTNLITACEPCNLGKGARTLSDDSAVTKQKRALDEQNERRLQLEMMFDWRRELDQYNAKRLDDFAAYWTSLTGYILTPSGEQSFRKLLNNRKGFTDQEILSAMSLAAEQYVVRRNDGVATESSAQEAFDKIGGILHVEREAEENPEIHDLYYVRGILNRRCSWLPKDVMEQLRDAHEAGVSVRQLKAAARYAHSWRQFEDALDELLQGPTQADSDEPVEESTKSRHDGWEDFLRDKFAVSDERARAIAGFLERCPSYALSSAFESCPNGDDPTLAQALSFVVLSSPPSLPGHTDLGVLNRIFLDELPRDWEAPFIYYVSLAKIDVLRLPGVIVEDFHREFTAQDLDLLQSPDVEWGGGLLRKSIVNQAARRLLRTALAVRDIEHADDRATTICRLYGAQGALELTGYLKDEGLVRWQYVLEMVSNLLGLPIDVLRTERDADEYMGLFRGCETEFMAVLKHEGILEFRHVADWSVYKARLEMA